MSSGSIDPTVDVNTGSLVGSFDFVAWTINDIICWVDGDQIKWYGL